MLSEEALSVADASGNRSEYIDALILGVRSMDDAINEDTVLLKHFKSMEQRILSLLQERLSQTPVPTPATSDPLEALAAQAFVPRPSDPIKGYPCWVGVSPCKHWVFDGADGIWRNNLTGATRDA